MLWRAQGGKKNERTRSISGAFSFWNLNLTRVSGYICTRGSFTATQTPSASLHTWICGFELFFLFSPLSSIFASPFLLKAAEHLDAGVSSRRLNALSACPSLLRCFSGGLPYGDVYLTFTYVVSSVSGCKHFHHCVFVYLLTEILQQSCTPECVHRTV